MTEQASNTVEQGSGGVRSPRCGLCGGIALPVNPGDTREYPGECTLVLPHLSEGACARQGSWAKEAPQKRQTPDPSNPVAPEPMQLDGRTLTREERALWDRCVGYTAALRAQGQAIATSRSENAQKVAREAGWLADALIRERRARGSK